MSSDDPLAIPPFLRRAPEPPTLVLSPQEVQRMGGLTAIQRELPGQRVVVREPIPMKK